MNDAVMRLTYVTKVYGMKYVLERLCFELPRGSVVGLLGKNGSGKTTLIKCALGLIKPDGGEVEYLGEPAWTAGAEAKARLGYVPQTITLYPWMKVKHIIDYTASFYPRWNDDLVDELRAEWEVAPEDRVGVLSVGQLQKLALILALGHEPDLLVLDEPAASLDPVARREFLKTVLGLASAGERTVLFSTHITSDIERVADRVALLKDGVILLHEELGALKDRVKRLRISAGAPLPDSLRIDGTLRAEVDGTDALVTVRACTPELIAGVETQYQASVEVEDLNLEEIFLEFHHA